MAMQWIRINVVVEIGVSMASVGGVGAQMYNAPRWSQSARFS